MPTIGDFLRLKKETETLLVKVKSRSPTPIVSMNTMRLLNEEKWIRYEADVSDLRGLVRQIQGLEPTGMTGDIYSGMIRKIQKIGERYGIQTSLI